MKPTFFILLLLALNLVSCNKSDSDPNNDTFALTVTGTVVDESGNPVSNAAIKLDNSTTTTDGAGKFSLVGGMGDGNRNFLTVKSEGKFDAYRGFITQNVTSVALQITLLDKGTAVTFDSADGAVISNAGGNVSISANSIKTATGNPYSGEVNGYLRMLNPSQPNFSQLMQGGDFAGVNSSSQTGNLKSYGFYSVELEDPNGNKLNLSDGTTASFSLPLASAEASSAPQTVKLWSFDKTKGIWKEEGTATKSGNRYIGNVSHFSEWNCDDWMSTTQVSGTWTAIPATECNTGIDAVSPFNSQGEYTIIYNMPTASSGTYTVNEACENTNTCNLFILQIDSAGNFYSSVDGTVTKTSANTFSFSCTVVSDCGYFDSPYVKGVVGSGTY